MVASSRTEIDDRRRLAVLFAALGLPTILFGAWMVAIGADGLALGWFLLMTVGAVIFGRLMLGALALKERE